MKNIKFENVTITTKANIYFEGKVISHSIVLQDGSKKTLGIIFPGQFHFNTDKAEHMEIITGSCSVKLKGNEEIKNYSEGQYFNVPAKSSFEIEIKKGTCEYICSFID